MADNRKNGHPVKKADIILKYGRSNFHKLNALLEQTKGLETDVSRISQQNEELYKTLSGEIKSLKQELKYLAMQNENVFVSVSEKVEKVSEIVERTTDSIPQSENREIDYDLLAEKVAQRIPVPQAVEGQPATYVAPVASSEPIDYDLLVDKLIARLPVYDDAAAHTQGTAPQIDYEYLANMVASRIPVQSGVAYASAEPVPVNVQVADPNFNYDYLADKVVSRIPVQESVSPDYIASKVAEQLVVSPQGNAVVDYDVLAEKLADKINVTSNVADNDCDYIAEKVAEKVVLPETRDFDYDYLAQRVAEKVVIPESRTAVGYASAPAGYDVNEDELADAIALKVGSLKPEDFEILVDDEGCASISKEITERLDYNLIASAVADKLRETLDLASDDETDYEEMAARISEKITVAGVNEDAIADKAAAVLSNYLPDFDSDEIADKVAEQVISAMPSVVNQDVMSETISTRLIESQKDNDYEMVLDEEGLDRMSESVYAKVCENTDERFNSIDRDIAEIKELLQSGVTVREETASTTAYEQYVAEESLVTVSDIIQDEYVEEEQPVEEVVEPEEEPVEEIAEELEEVIEEQPVEEVVEEPVAEPEPVEEKPVEEEKEPEIKVPPVIVVPVAVGGEEESEENGEIEVNGGVDFANMMRYDRSFISRIIQSTDEQKRFYGEVRNALLSYRRVNSNVAWGAERFHKGRETIARFKIRGKTLVLYLALDPATHEYSVYHHKDVSDNKSLKGTPMMIKIMSPRGVKKAIRLIDEMLEARNGIKRHVPERDYAAMYPYETIEELIEDGLVKDVNKK